MDGLFSAVDLDSGGARVGYRLDRLEMYNWGTFDKHVWTFHPGMDNTLLTGDVGSGKSTIVDAITTLLLPANRISYNKAAGAETRERNLRSYVLGYHKSERSEVTGTSKPVGLRRADAYSVLLATFINEGMSDTVTVAQVFWFTASNQGQPDRFYVVTDDRLSIAEDCADFGGQIANLKRRLRKSGARVYDHFPDYGREFRRRLGIPSEQAMELFHQTVSMKSVGDLNEFVRDHMLEPFDMASRIKDLLQHFGDLNAAHEAVLKARAQLGLLAPLLADCGEYDRLSTEITSLSAQRTATRYFCAERKVRLLDTRVGELTQREEDLAGQERSLGTHITDLRNELTHLEVERAGHGGNRIAEIGREIEAEISVKEQRENRHRQFSTWLADAQLDPVTSAAEFAQRRTEIDEATVSANDRRTQLQNALTDAEVEVRELDREVKEVNDELLSLRERPNNIPRKSLDLRDRLCGALGMDADQLPFAGELIAVRGNSREWEGAAERVLHSFGLSVLVADEHYARVADWINENHLGMRLVYYRVPAKIGQSRVEPAGPRPLYEMLEIKESPFEPWLRRELTRRANYVCVDSMREFRRAASAVTRQGQIKGSGGRHEKDDRTRIDDRRSYVLGWTNESKIDALIDQAAALQHKVDAAKKTRDDTVSELSTVNSRTTALSKLGDVTEYDDLDWGRSVTRIDELDDERKKLEASSEELRSITKKIEDVTEQIDEAEDRKREVTSELGGVRAQRRSAEREHTIAKEVLDEPGYADAPEHFAALDELAVGRDRAEPADWDRFAEQAVSQINSGIEKCNSQRNGAGQRAVAKMRDFHGRYPLETTEADDSIEAADEYRKLHDQLQDDDLPRFERDFKDFLNTNTIRDIANFQSQLNKQLELIKERVDTINDSLVAIDYNPGRYIQLEQEPTDNIEVRQFRSDLRACTASSLGEEQSEQYSEDKFLQVKAIIERFAGREGQTDADRQWTRRVTDVRNWSVFSATERWREDDTEHEHYTDSGGKSGGQKEKLAYTILAASLAYQFKLEWGSTRSKNFQFVVIDEAFGRGSDNSTRFALRLFQKLGLQLLVITPLQKIHVIEPYVLSVGFVDNRSGKYSRLQTLTIEEYRERMAAAGTVAVTAGDGR